MSDIREHVSDTLEDRLLHMARTSAYMHRVDHVYLPQTVLQTVQFMPHAWVLHAMKTAHSAGRNAGADELRRTLRLILGVNP